MPDKSEKRPKRARQEQKECQRPERAREEGRMPQKWTLNLKATGFYPKNKLGGGNFERRKYYYYI